VTRDEWIKEKTEIGREFSRLVETEKKLAKDKEKLLDRLEQLQCYWPGLKFKSNEEKRK
jgi:hypothetical protein